MWKDRIKQAAPLLLVTAICLLLSLEVMSDFFIYRRTDILHGEYWRLVSGNFVHLNWQHLLLNLVAWFLIWAYGAHLCNTVRWSLLLLLCAGGVGIGLLLMLPEIGVYSGLSGVLHGLFIAISGLRLLIRRSDYSAWIILALVMTKLIFEGVRGASDTAADWIGLMIISEAHLYGAASGAVLIIVIVLIGVARRKIFSRA